MAKILDGKMVATEIKQRIAKDVRARGIKPCLATILVGDDVASEVYVRNKQKDCAECGFENVHYHISESDATTESLVSLVSSLSDDITINGILVQLPLPKHIDTDRVIAAISPQKDVDCFTPYNIGLLYQGNPKFIPCTPYGVIELLKYYGIEISGKRCVIVGRSNIVGKPMFALALQNNATVTVCHSHTKNLGNICKTADILISAVGRPGFIQESDVKDGAVIIDVGINRDSNGKMCGDCDPIAYEKSSAYTPVPGGVGQMTRAMLMLNTLKSYDMS